LKPFRKRECSDKNLAKTMSLVGDERRPSYKWSSSG
jgi:hypothetical protein